MRALLFVLLVIGSILALSAGNSFAQNPVAQNNIPTTSTTLGVYAQLVIRDSSGHLVSYIETSRVVVHNATKFNQMIDNNIDRFKRTVINSGGRDFEVFQLNASIVHQSPTIVSQNLIDMTTIAGRELLAAADHDGYPVVAGDNVTTYWTIIRSLS
ncbi:MAG: hypothetical protein KGI08_10035 [Thaumarchaeota archaeon]|nr:hypothetical protein [Nitrososphaerota archaeon]